ncbi:MAG: hypothetical protein JJ966_01120 [Balneolaceae bacterium]|jgi:hypothetical protein|nr:hypothetical protein [Balneolaceae bacterium]
MKFRLLYLLWLFPCYLAFISIQQLNVYRGTIYTYNNGESIAADVTDFDIKQIAAQSNGYVDLKFVDPEGETVERRLSLSVQMAQKIMDTAVIPIRYKEGAYQEIVMIPTYDLQRSTSFMNMIIALIGLSILSVVMIFVTKYANRRAAGESSKFSIERVDV